MSSSVRLRLWFARLFRGRRWAYRRIVLIAGIGISGLLILQLSPYPTWMRVEQLLQALILPGLLSCVLQPEVRSHFAVRLPGRDQGRFSRK